MPSEAAAFLNRPPCALRWADGVGRDGAGRPDGPDRPTGCRARGMPGNGSQGHAREAPPPPGLSEGPPSGPTPPGPRAHPREHTAGCGGGGCPGPNPVCAMGLRSLGVHMVAWRPGNRQQHWKETRDRMKRPSGFLVGSHARWRGSGTGLMMIKKLMSPRPEGPLESRCT